MMDFDPINTAKEVVGELAKGVESQFADALLFQAGLRTLLPVSEREGVALPRVFPNDPPALQQAQTTVIDLLTTGREATAEEKQSAYAAIADAASRFGNKGLAASVTSWLKTEGFQPQQEAARPSGIGGDFAWGGNGAFPNRDDDRPASTLTAPKP